MIFIFNMGIVTRCYWPPHIVVHVHTPVLVLMYILHDSTIYMIHLLSYEHLDPKYIAPSSLYCLSWSFIWTILCPTWLSHAPLKKPVKQLMRLLNYKPVRESVQISIVCIRLNCLSSSIVHNWVDKYIIMRCVGWNFLYSLVF